jgi:hypothetical protein
MSSSLSSIFNILIATRNYYGTSVIKTINEYGQGKAHGRGTWKVDITTRKITNTEGMSPGLWQHTPFWIFTDLSIGENVIIARVYDNDENFNVTNYLSHNYTGYGSLNIWQLEDTIGSVLWYENSTGILLNGTFFWTSAGGGWLKHNFAGTNVFEGPGDVGDGGGPGVPGFSLYFLIGTLSLAAISMSIIMTKRRKFKQRNMV